VYEHEREFRIKVIKLKRMSNCVNKYNNSKLESGEVGWSNKEDDTEGLSEWV